MRFSLNAFSHRLTIKSTRQSNNTSNDCLVALVFQHVTHERLVYLEHINRQATQITQRAIASAEIIQRKSHTKRATRLYYFSHNDEVIERYRFQHFDL